MKWKSLIKRTIIFVSSAFLFGGGEYFYFHYQLPRPSGYLYQLSVFPIVLALCYLSIKGVDKSKIKITVLLTLLVLPLWTVIEDFSYFLTDYLSFQKWEFPMSLLPPINQWRAAAFGQIHPFLGAIAGELEKVGWLRLPTGYWYGSLTTIIGLSIYAVLRKKSLRCNKL